jgi:hypothetical protein
MGPKFVLDDLAILPCCCNQKIVINRDKLTLFLINWPVSPIK